LKERTILDQLRLVGAVIKISQYSLPEDLGKNGGKLVGNN